mmetsp:Transcript_23566/g.35286  ORF Transcript_23566/g.35286 Transcript_23566/m.35286 type:complete len:108 (+) Transcript_23566:43-366(+)
MPIRWVTGPKSTVFDWNCPRVRARHKYYQESWDIIHRQRNEDKARKERRRKKRKAEAKERRRKKRKEQKDESITEGGQANRDEQSGENVGFVKKKRTRHEKKVKDSQ